MESPSLLYHILGRMVRHNRAKKTQVPSVIGLIDLFLHVIMGYHLLTDAFAAKKHASYSVIYLPDMNELTNESSGSVFFDEQCCDVVLPPECFKIVALC